MAWYYFTGKKTDDESGLIYFGARYYDPSLGRFITADTIVPSPTNPQTLNRYSYAGNNPVSHLEDGHGFWRSFFRAVMQAFITAVLTPFIGFPLAAATGAAATTAAFGGSSREIGINAGIAFVTAGIFSQFGMTDTGQLTGFGKAMVGLSIVGGLAYSASADGGQGVENFVAGFLGAVAGGYAGSTVADGIQSMLKNPATAEGGNHNAQVNENVKQVQEGKTDRTGLVQSANNSKGDVQGFTAKVEAYAKLSGQEVNHQLESGAFKFTSNGGIRGTAGPNWKTIGIGAAELSAGVTGLGSALAIEGVSLGTGGLVAGWRAFSGVMTMAVGVADVMLGIYGQRTSVELVADALKNNPFGQRIYQMTPVGAE